MSEDLAIIGGRNSRFFASMTCELHHCRAPGRSFCLSLTTLPQSVRAVNTSFGQFGPDWKRGLKRRHRTYTKGHSG